MSIPEIRAYEHLQSVDLRLAEPAGANSIKQTTEFEPDFPGMSMEEYKAYVHWTAMSGDVSGTSLNDLLAIDQTLYSHRRDAMKQIVGLTVSVSALQTELGTSFDNQVAMNQITSATKKLYGLYGDVELLQPKVAWVRGYIQDRRPKSE